MYGEDYIYAYAGDPKCIKSKEERDENGTHGKHHLKLQH